jgi:hypothetical protein
MNGMNAMSPQSVMGKTYNLNRPKNGGEAEAIDPRSGSATFSDPGYVTIPITWDKLFVKGFPIYGIDLNPRKYIQDYSLSCAGSVGHSVDNYFYTKCFRDYSGIAASGSVSYAGQYPPVQIVFSETSGGALNTFDRNLLIWANQRLNTSEVPQGMRFALISPMSAGTFLQNAPTDTGENFVGAQAGGVGLLTGGLSGFLPRYGFNLGEANAVTGQSRVTDLGDGAATCAVSAYTADTTVFLDGEMTTSTPLGAVRATLTITAALNSGIAVGKIARLGADAGAAKAYGVILRVDTTNKYVWLVPYDANGNKLTAAQLSTSTDKFGIPQINSVNTAHHSEFVGYINAPIAQPVTQGPVVRSATWQGLQLTVMFGNYDIGNVSEKAGCYWFGGCTPTDPRKAVLMLSA